MPHLRILTDREWQEADDRLALTRASYLRGTHGRLWGRPANGLESKYLLTGLAQCSERGDSLYVRSRSHGERRAFFYGRTSYHLRGRTVCTNHMELPLPEVDRHVLATIEADILQPDVLAAAIRRKKLEQDLATVEAALARLTGAIEAGGDLPTFLAAIKEREQARKTIQQQLSGLNDLTRLQTFDVRRLRHELERRLTNWQGLLGRHVGQTRQILHKLLVGRLRFTFDQESQTCEFIGQGVLGPILTGMMGPKAMVSPTGSYIGGKNPFAFTIDLRAIA